MQFVFVKTLLICQQSAHIEIPCDDKTALKLKTAREFMGVRMQCS